MNTQPQHSFQACVLDDPALGPYEEASGRLLHERSLRIT
jgi:hypothetical protein